MILPFGEAFKARLRRPVRRSFTALVILAISLVGWLPPGPVLADHVKQLQAEAMSQGRAPWGHWGADPEKYTGWSSHSNRLVPVYTFGLSLESVAGANSVYRDAKRIERLYGRLPEGTLNTAAEYFDQTDICRLQQAAAAAGKKYIILVVFDGMDWQTTWAAAIHNSDKVGYRAGHGTGLHFLDYRGVATDYGFAVTSPHNDGTTCDIDTQTLVNPGGKTLGGYDAQLGGPNPWTPGSDPLYLIGQSRLRRNAVTDSAASATAMCSGIKTYNDSVNVDPQGRQVVPVARQLQAKGYAVGVLTSVPISHATPACAYSNNVWRDDYQDLARDLLGLPSVSHPSDPLPGVDVLLGAGWGDDVDGDSKQGRNFIPGNKYVAAADVQRIDAARGGRYRVVRRAAGANGAQALAEAADDAARRGLRLLGMFGVKAGHLPFCTADGKFDPTAGVRRLGETYSPADLDENPTLADMTRAALKVLERNRRGFWLMVEAGDVDWANHDDNIDTSIGAVISGDDAFRAITAWAEERKCWDQTAVIVTSDHGHYLVLTRPEALLDAPNRASESAQ
jgi:alkaline phosphatase